MAYQLLTCLGRLFTSFLSLQGFTLGIEDVLVKTKVKCFLLFSYYPIVVTINMFHPQRKRGVKKNENFIV